MTITISDLAELKHLCEAANADSSYDRHAELAFADTARAAIPRLIAALDEARAEIERLRRVMRDLRTADDVEKEIASWPK